MTATSSSLDRRAADSALFARANLFEVDLDALDYNVRAIRRMVGHEVSLFAALKANAYGFGTLAVAATILAAGADGLAVVDLRDAVGLREAGISAPIHLYGGMLVTPDVARCVDALDLMPTILSLDDAGVYSRSASKPIRVFVKVEVGLERFGIAPEETPAFVQAIRSMPNLPPPRTKYTPPRSSSPSRRRCTLPVKPIRALRAVDRRRRSDGDARPNQDGGVERFAQPNADDGSERG